MNIHTDDPTTPNRPLQTVDDALQIAKTGDKSAARELLTQIVAREPRNQAAWLGLSVVAENKSAAEKALAQARQINPDQPTLQQAEQWLAREYSVADATRHTPIIDTEQESSSPDPQGFGIPTGHDDPEGLKPRKTFVRQASWFAVGLISTFLLIGLIGLFIGLAVEIYAATQPAPNHRPPAELELAWQQRDWQAAISLLEPMYNEQPETTLIQGWLAHAYIQHGVQLRQKGFVEASQPYFEQALTLAPNQWRAQQEKQLAEQYQVGATAYQTGNWDQAIDQLQAVWQVEPDYVATRDLLYSSYFNHGLGQQAAGNYGIAWQAFEAAVTVRPDLPYPRRYLAQLNYLTRPATVIEPEVPIEATPVLTDKLILVGLNEQEMWVFEGDQKIYEFIVSTGDQQSATLPGEFEILNKIDVAYASTWNLDMPYWMGIYWSGSLQNGIHALPIVRHTGYKLWDGYLGQRVSYGCVILGDGDAKTLYDWAEVGVKVKIVHSLAEWEAERLSAQ